MAGLIISMLKAQVAQSFLGHHDEAILRSQAYEQVAFFRHVAFPAEISHQAWPHPGGFPFFWVLQLNSERGALDPSSKALSLTKE